METNDNHNSRSIFTVLATALAALVLLSLLPWGRATDHVLKDFNLVGDIMRGGDTTFVSHDQLDPDLAALAAEPLSMSAATDTTVAQPQTTALPDDFRAPAASDGTVLIEDYTPGHDGLRRVAAGLAAASRGLYRIAVLGDSYIEGDILTQDIRSQLQTAYGGSGVGYMAAYSELPGFRRSVKQSGTGWTGREIRKMKPGDFRTLSGQYFTAKAGASARYKGTSKVANAATWDRSTILFIAPAGGTVTLRGGEGTADEVCRVEPSTTVQALTLDKPAGEFAFSTDIDGLAVLGVWLESTHGVQVDNMSLRGNSGISHRNLNMDVISGMRRHIDYNLIILEFGINALASNQTDYTAYANAMQQTVNTVKRAYPDATVMLLGIGDRGQKRGTEIGSMPTAAAMVKAQRDVARATGVLFWDMRAAMGGDGAVVDWNGRGLVNADYIHLNHKGGKALADIFVNSLNKSIRE